MRLPTLTNHHDATVYVTLSAAGPVKVCCSGCGEPLADERASSDDPLVIRRGDSFTLNLLSERWREAPLRSVANTWRYSWLWCRLAVRFYAGV